MAKAKTTKPHITQESMRITTTVGYVIFILIIASVIGAGVPFIHLLSVAPHMSLMLTVSLLGAWVLGALIPTLVAYAFGSHDTYRKNRLLHHYNGVLFGIVAYWIALTTIGIPISTSNIYSQIDPSWGPFVVNVIPAIIAVIIMAVVGAFYAKQKAHQQGILAYHPFQAVVVLSLLFGTIAPFIQSFSYTHGDSGMVWASVIEIALLLVFIGISYRALKIGRLLRGERMAHSIVIFAFAITFWQTTAILTRSIFPNDSLDISTYVAFGLGVILWIVYLVLQRRALR
jgi:hypothetical protein